jgi:hypothetical protein
VGYEQDGAFHVAREGAAVVHNRYVMSRERWESVRSYHAQSLGGAVELHGIDGLRAQLEPIPSGAEAGQH